MQETLAVSSIDHAKSLYRLADIEVSEGNETAAAELFEQAIAILEAQTERLGGVDDARAHFMERYSVYFKEYSSLLLDAGKQTRAFDVLERYRARSLLAMLAERDQSLTLALPISLDQERRRVEADYNTARSELAYLVSSGTSGADIQEAQDRVSENKAAPRRVSTSA